MLDEIVNSVKVLCENKIDDLAVLNILQAKLVHAFALKDVKFISIQNVNRARPMAYYAFNFIPSGGMKNLPHDVIDDSLLTFVEDYLKQYNYKRRNELECKQVMELQDITDKVELRRKKQEQERELNALKDLPRELPNATQASIYANLKIIKEVGNGSICIYNSEFCNFYEDAILNRDKNKKEFLDNLYDLYDGNYQGMDTVSTSRESIKDIPVSVIFLSDYKLLNENEKLSSNYKSYLTRGMARRSYIYFKQNENYHLKKNIYPSFDERQRATDNLKIFGDRLKQIFDNISDHKIYHFEMATNERINEYKREIDDRIAEFYKYTNRLDINTEILKLNLEHSTWKIIKLAVLYHILDTNGQGSYVSVESFNKAVEFFNKMHNCLDLLLRDRMITDYDKLYNYLVANRNKWISKMELRSQNFVPAREFKTWLEDALLAISELAESKGFAIVQRATGNRNQGCEIALYEPSVYRFESKIVDNVEKGQLIKIDNSDLEVTVI